MRDANPDHWLELWHSMLLDKMMDELESSCEYVVIVDDVRYENELTLINNLSNSKTIFVSEGTRSGTLEDEYASWRNHHSEYLANEAAANWDNYRDQFDFLFRNDGDVYNDLKEYITAGDDCGKVIEAWLGNHDCPCAFCDAHIQNTSINEEALIREMNDVLGAVPEVELDLDEDDDDDDLVDEDMEAINRALGELFGMDEIDVDDIITNIVEDRDDEDEEESDEDS